MNKDELKEKRNRTIESLNDIKAILGLDELYIDELEKELADAKKVQVVEHFEAYGQCRTRTRKCRTERKVCQKYNRLRYMRHLLQFTTHQSKRPYKKVIRLFATRYK